MAISSSNLADDQSQLVVSCLQDESLTGISSFYRHYTIGYVHRFAFDPCVEELMADKFGLTDCYLLYDAYQPSAGHESYGDVSMAGALQRYVDYKSCAVCGFSILGAVSFRSVHRCCKVVLYIPHRPVGCVDVIYCVGSLGYLLYLGSDISRACFSWVPDFGVWVSCIRQFDYGFLLVIFQRLLQEPMLIESNIVHDYIWDPGGLTGLLLGHCLGTSNFRKGGL